MRTEDFEYDLPAELIAQEPAARRDQSRLLVLDRAGGLLAHRRFKDLPEHLRAGDVLVLNDTRVIPARLRGVNARSGGEFELLLLEENARNDWWAMIRPGKRARVGVSIALRPLPGVPRAAAAAAGCGSDGEPQAQVVAVNKEGHRRLVFSGLTDLKAVLDVFGEAPLPPYIKRAAPNVGPEDRERYQTVYARRDGSVAAPTAGLHFTRGLLERIRAMGVDVCYVTLHVGLGTFAPVKAESLQDHVMHEERFSVTSEAANCLNAAHQAGRRIMAVGSTSLRVLESLAARHESRVLAGEGATRLFVYPPYSFRLVGGLLTNFHLPRSTLLMLVSAFVSPGRTCGLDLVLAAYAEAVRERYRFFSYGDAMLIL